MNVQAETSQDEDEDLVFPMMMPESWQQPLPHSTSIWSMQLKSKDNSMLSPIA